MWWTNIAIYLGVGLVLASAFAIFLHAGAKHFHARSLLIDWDAYVTIVFLWPVHLVLCVFVGIWFAWTEAHECSGKD